MSYSLWASENIRPGVWAPRRLPTLIGKRPHVRAAAMWRRRHAASRHEAQSDAALAVAIAKWSGASLTSSGAAMYRCPTPANKNKKSLKLYIGRERNKMFDPTVPTPSHRSPDGWDGPCTPQAATARPPPVLRYRRSNYGCPVAMRP